LSNVVAVCPGDGAGVVVKAVPPHLCWPQPLPAGTVSLTLTGAPAWSCTLQSSSNLSQWSLLTNIVLDVTRTATVTDAPGGGSPAHFYRVLAW
jgi:hypothetical protein